MSGHLYKAVAVTSFKEIPTSYFVFTFIKQLAL